MAFWKVEYSGVATSHAPRFLTVQADGRSDALTRAQRVLDKRHGKGKARVRGPLRTFRV